MRLECVTICYSYSDFLEHSLKENMQYIDRIVIVTHPNDHKTKKLCNYLSIDCIETEVFHDDGDAMNKGRAINVGLSNLRNDGWLIHLDADIVLPHAFRNLLSQAKLNEKNLYGADRLNTKSHANWIKHKDKLIPHHAWRYMITPEKEFEFGSRLMHMEYGYCPIGYFQLWHSSMNRRYPVIAGSAEHSDVVFAIQWARQNRILLPEVLVYHLESEQTEMGKNWNGRKTSTFGNPKELHQPTRYR